jgi:hypothetical protein
VRECCHRETDLGELSVELIEQIRLNLQAKFPASLRLLREKPSLFPFIEDQGDDGGYADGEDGDDICLRGDDRDPLEQFFVVDFVVVLENLAVLFYEGGHVESRKKQEHKMCRLSAAGTIKSQPPFLGQG